MIAISNFQLRVRSKIFTDPIISSFDFRVTVGKAFHESTMWFNTLLS